MGYQESISVHPTRRQIFAGKPDSTFPNIWEWLLYTFYLIFDATIPDKKRRTLRGNMDDQKSDILRS